MIGEDNCNDCPTHKFKPCSNAARNSSNVKSALRLSGLRWVEGGLSPARIIVRAAEIALQPFPIPSTEYCSVVSFSNLALDGFLPHPNGRSRVGRDPTQSYQTHSRVFLPARVRLLP
jgi:hypothetical protein